MENDYKSGLRDAISILDTKPTTDIVIELMMRLKRQCNSIALLQQEVKTLKSNIETTDSVMAEAEIKVPCIVCDRYYPLDYEVSQYDPLMSYCGGSERCCP